MQNETMSNAKLAASKNVSRKCPVLSVPETGLLWQEVYRFRLSGSLLLPEKESLEINRPV